MSKATLADIIGKPISGEWGTEDEAGNGIPVLRTANFTNEGVISYTNVVTRSIPAAKLAGKMLEPGDIILEKSGGSDKQPVGRVVYFNGQSGKYSFNNFTCVLRVKDRDQWNPKYVFYALFANYKRGGTKRFENKTTGLHNLKVGLYVRNFALPIPTLDQQNGIVAVLDKVDALIRAREEQAAKLRELVRARFVEMFGDPAFAPKYSKTVLSRICTKITDGEHASVPRVPKGYPFLNAKHILKDGTIDWSSVTYVDGENHERIYKRCNPEQGDILLTTTGTIGNVAIVPQTDQFSMDRGITLLKINHQLVTSEFVAEMLRQDSIQMVMTSNVHASAIGHLFMNKVKEIPIEVPPLEAQIRFSRFVRATLMTRVRAEKSRAALETLKGALMQRYFA